MTKYQTEFDRHYEAALEILNKLGSFEKAYQYIDDLEDEDYRDTTLARVAQFLAGRGDVEQALRLCSSVHYALARADAFIEVARNVKKKGLAEASKRILREAIVAAEAIERSSWETPTILLRLVLN